MALPDAALAHDQRINSITAGTLAAAQRQWRLIGSDFDASWSVIGPRLLLLLAAAQAAAARGAEQYVAGVADELGLPNDPAGRVQPGGFVGVASDGRRLDTLLYEPIIAAKTLVAAGNQPAAALNGALSLLDAIVSTQVADTDRAASSVATAARPGIGGYIRMVSTPCCSRCAVLAGKWYRWNQGFARHPRCHCRHIPASENVAGDLRTNPDALVRAGQVRGLSKADTRAIIEDGADVSQVINAHRGMSVEQVFGRATKITREGITRRGVAGKRLGDSSRGIRLRPESIYQLAKDREDAIRLLRHYGYLT